MISDAYEGLKAAMRKVISANWQRSWVHSCARCSCMPLPGNAVSSTPVATFFAQTTQRPACDQWCTVADLSRERFSRSAKLLGEAEDDVLAYTSFPRELRTKIHSTNSLERLSGAIRRHTDFVGIFPNTASISLLVDALLFEQDDECALQRH